MPAESRTSDKQKLGNGSKVNLPSDGRSDRFSRFQTHFGRFLWDVFGSLLLVFGLITLLGLLGLSKGILLLQFISVIRIWFGWGSLFIVITSILGGWLAFRRSRQELKFQWGQVVTLELAAFLTLAVLSIFGGNSLYQAENGWWGGRIGWGLAVFVIRLLGPMGGGICIFVVWGLTIISGFGFWRRLEIWLFQQAGESVSSNVPSISPATPTISQLPQNDFENGIEHQINQARKKLLPDSRSLFKTKNGQENQHTKKTSREERLPPLNILLDEQKSRTDERNINQTAGLLEKALSELGIPVKVIGFRTGPTVTQFAVQPGYIKKQGSTENDPIQMKVRVAQIAALKKDLAMALSAESLRIEAPVPGHSYVGIEVPNSKLHVVRLRPLMESETFYRINSPLAIAIGRDVSGNPIAFDLIHMPHILIAGTTGSGKSVCISSITACLAMNNTPEDLRLVLIDSKMVELIRFNGLAHLLGKVETDVKRILGVLRWVVSEMEHRYLLLEAARARDIEVYNRRLQRRKDVQPLPRIVVIIDELADLMMSALDQTEHNLVRLAQLARATGIHLVVATQRPSAEIVTGLIKANFPARIAFAVTSQVDSRVILDVPGAEDLLSRGDMLFLNPKIGSPIRVQGVMVTDQEIERIIAYWQNIAPQDTKPPWEALLSQPDEDSDDVLVEQAITILKQERRASASLLQRRLRIGYPRAARLLDQLEEMGIVGHSMSGGRDREVFIEEEEKE